MARQALPVLEDSSARTLDALVGVARSAGASQTGLVARRARAGAAGAAACEYRQGRPIGALGALVRSRPAATVARFVALLARRISLLPVMPDAARHALIIPLVPTIVACGVAFGAFVCKRGILLFRIIPICRRQALVCSGCRAVLVRAVAGRAALVARHALEADRGFRVPAIEAERAIRALRHALGGVKTGVTTVRATRITRLARGCISFAAAVVKEPQGATADLDHRLI